MYCIIYYGTFTHLLMTCWMFQLPQERPYFVEIVEILAVCPWSQMEENKTKKLGSRSGMNITHLVRNWTIWPPPFTLLHYQNVNDNWNMTEWQKINGQLSAIGEIFRLPYILHKLFLWHENKYNEKYCFGSWVIFCVIPTYVLYTCTSIRKLSCIQLYLGLHESLDFILDMIIESYSIW